MTTRDSPSSPFIFVPKAANGKDLVLKTQPFYSMLYYTEPVTIDGFRKLVRHGAKENPSHNKTLDSNKTCQRVFTQSPDQTYSVYKRLSFAPFSTSGIGATNLSFLMVVFVTTILVGTITFSYWTYLLGNNVMDDNFRQAIQKRSIYLSVFFLVMSIILCVMFYEFFTLKFLSLTWFRGYQSRTPTNFYDFLLNTRKIVLWGFLTVGLALVLFITTTLSKRPEKFKSQIALNVLAISILFCSQYLYYQSQSPSFKTFYLWLCVSIIAWVMYLLYIS